MYKTIASFNGDVKIYDGKLGYANLLKLTGEMPKNIEHIEVLHNDDDFGDFYSWSNKIVENNFGSNFKEGFPIVNFSKDGVEREITTAYGELENGVSVLFDKDSLEWVVEFAKGGEINHEETYKKWKSLVNMSKSELENFYNSEEGKKAGLSSSEANELGIHSGRESARWIMKMKDTPHQDWTPKMWEWAKRQISFISRMSGNKGGLYDDKGNKTRKHTSLLIWGHNPKKYASGGTISQTPASKEDKVYGSKVNAKGSSKDTKTAKEIKFDAKTLLSINEKVREHNKQHPNKKITLASAKAVVRRGMGAYSSTHRPTISGGKPNSRVAWGLARLNAFMYKIIHGKSKSGKYKQDDDLINELGYSVKSYEDGGSLELLATNTTFDAKNNDIRYEKGGIFNDKELLSKWKKGESIGFTAIAHLKAKGLIPRADGTKRKSEKYMDNGGLIEQLRAEEQSEYHNMSNPKDEIKRKEIYDKYDKLITPLMENGGSVQKLIQLPDVQASEDSLKRVLDMQGYTLDKKSLFKPHKTIEQIAVEKNVPLSFAKEQLAKGMKIESEHSNSIDVQKTIALQHLDEMIDYYKKLEIMEQPKDIDKYYGSIKRSYSNGGEVDSIYTFPTPTGAYTMLQYVQQVLVRTTEFKKYFGDWELAAKNFLADKRTNFEKHYKNVSKVINLITLEPLVVYHGSSAIKEFFEFDATAKNEQGRPYAYFADNIEYSKNFVPSIIQRLLRGDAKALLYKAFIKINNPFFALGSEFEQIRKNKDGWILTLTQKIYADKEGGVMDEAVFNDYMKATKSQLEKYFEDTFANRDFLFWNIMSKDFNKTFKTFLIVNGYDGVRYSEEFDPTNYDENNLAQFTKAWTIFDASQVKLADGRNINFDPMNKDIRFEEGGDIKEPDIVVDVQTQSRASELRNKIGLKMDAGGFLLGKKDGKLIAHNDGDLGGIFVGKRHSEGGIEGINKATGQPIEVEGEEIQLNSKAVSDSSLKEFNGKKMTNREILSHLNVEGGGKSFKMGGEIEDKLEKGASIKNAGKGNPIEYSGGEVILTRGAVSSDKKYEYNGKMMTTREIASEMNVANGGISFASGGNIPQKTHNFVLEKTNDAIDYVNDFINRIYG